MSDDRSQIGATPDTSDADERVAGAGARADADAEPQAARDLPATADAATAPGLESMSAPVRPRTRLWLRYAAAGFAVVAVAALAIAIVGRAGRPATPLHEVASPPSATLPSSTPTVPGTAGGETTRTAAETATPPAGGSPGAGSGPASETAVPARSVPSPDLRSAVTVLMYHHVMPAPDNNIAITPESFDAQMRWLRDNGFHPISMAEMEEFVLHGRRLPLRPVLITFDDGRMNQITYAVPILHKYGFTATFFVVQNWAVSPDRTVMHPDQLRQLVADGYDVESHTANHWLMIRKHGASFATFTVREWPAVFGIRSWLRNEIGTPTVRALAYPGGYLDAFGMRIAQQAGYELAFTTQPGYVSYRAQDQYALPRFNAGARGLRMSTFARIVSGSLREAPISRDHAPVVVTP